MALRAFGRRIFGVHRPSFLRRFSSEDEKGEEAGEVCKDRNVNGLVLGMYTNPDFEEDKGKLTPTAERYNKLVCNRIMELMRVIPGGPPKKQELRVFYGLDEEFPVVAVVGLGRQCQGYDVFEQIDEGKETIRETAAIGSKMMQKLGIKRVFVESFGHAESSAEGAALGVWLYQEKRNKEKQIHIPNLELYDDCDFTGWQIGLQKAAAQNLARQLMDTSSNLMTPTSFAQNAVEVRRI